MAKTEPLPQSGGSYLHDETTGELIKAPVPAPLPVAAEAEVKPQPAPAAPVKEKSK